MGIGRWQDSAFWILNIFESLFCWGVIGSGLASLKERALGRCVWCQVGSLLTLQLVKFHEDVCKISLYVSFSFLEKVCVWDSREYEG